MKVNEIIAEERTDEIIGAVLKGIGALARGAKTGIKDIGKLPSAIRTKNMFSNSIWGKYARSRLVRQTRNARQLYRVRAENFAKDALGDEILKWTTRIALADGIYDYYSASSLLDDLLKNGEITKEQYDEDLTKLRGLFVTSILVPRLAGGLTKVSTGLVGSIISKLGGPRAGEAIRFWGGTVAKVGEASALAYFSTDAGKKWLTDSMSNLVTGLGSASDLVMGFLSLVKAAAQVATGILPPGYEQEKERGKFEKDPWKGTGREVGIL